MNEIIKNRPWINDILKKPEMQDITLINLYVYYLTNNNINKLLPIITSNSNISIRVLDWFVTNYCKKYNINYLNGLISFFPFKSYTHRVYETIIV